MPPCCHFFFVLIAGRKGSPVCFQPHLSGEQCRGSGVLRQLRWTCSTGHGLSITQKNSHPADYPGLGLTGNKGSWHWSCMKPGWSLPRMQSTGRRRQDCMRCASALSTRASGSSVALCPQKP